MILIKFKAFQNNKLKKTKTKLIESKETLISNYDISYFVCSK